MKFKDALSTIKRLVTVKKETRKYLIYATIVIAILGIIGVAIQNNLNEKLAKEKSDLEGLNEDRAAANAELNAQLADLQFASDELLIDLETIRLAEAASKVEIELMEIEISESKVRSDDLFVRLKAVHDDLAGSNLVPSFLGDIIEQELVNYFPDAGHVFFTQTQSDLFKANPETANLIYTVITENAVRIQIIGGLTDQVTIVTDLLEQTTTLVTLKDEEIEAYENLTVEFNETFDNLEAALSLERRTTSNLERQIAIMNRKNFFERILPSLNVVIGPYYDPFRNQGGFAIALGLGWRF